MRMSALAPTLRVRARRLRREQTAAERKLWARLRARQVDGAKFRRQHPIGRYIADFCCPERGLVVELDGGQHADQVETDRRRTAFLEQQGFRVLRFWDNDMMQNIDAVLEQITEVLRDPRWDRPPSTSPSPLRGEGKDGARGEKKRPR